MRLRPSRLRPSRLRPSRFRSSRFGRRDDRGETLLELTIAVAILGLGVTSILGAVLIAVSSSSLDQRQVQAQARLKSWAEKLNGTGYVDCAGAGGYPAYTTFAAQTPPVPALPNGFHASYTEVRYWDSASQQFVTSLASCSGSPAKDQGVQRVRLRITADPGLYPGFTTYLWVTVRKPCTALGAC